MIEIGNIVDMSAQEITSRIIAYRKSKFADVVSIEKTLKKILSVDAVEMQSNCCNSTLALLSIKGGLLNERIDSCAFW